MNRRWRHWTAGRRLMIGWVASSVSQFVLSTRGPALGHVTPMIRQWNGKMKLERATRQVNPGFDSSTVFFFFFFPSLSLSPSDFFHQFLMLYDASPQFDQRGCGLGVKTHFSLSLSVRPAVYLFINQNLSLSLSLSLSLIHTHTDSLTHTLTQSEREREKERKFSDQTSFNISTAEVNTPTTAAALIERAVPHSLPDSL